MSQNNKIADFVMHRRSSPENCSFGIFNYESAFLLTLDSKQIMQIVMLEALMSQNLLKLNQWSVESKISFYTPKTRIVTK